MIERMACRLRRLWRMTRAVLHVVAGAFAAQLLLINPNAPLPRAHVQRAQRAVVRWWVRGLCRLLHLEVQVRGAAPTRPTLLVMNHVSWLDIPAILATVDADFVSKQDVTGWPVIGTMTRRAGTIFLARGGRAAAATTADHMTWRLAQRRHVVMFPEGTTTDGRRVLAFHARLYQAAIRTHSRVQAVAVRYPQLDGPRGTAPFIDDDELLPHLWRLLGEKRIVVELHFCDPLVPDADRRALANHTRHQVCTALGFETARPALASIRRRDSHERAAR